MKIILNNGEKLKPVEELNKSQEIKTDKNNEIIDGHHRFLFLVKKLVKIWEK
jgi:hypothetical protein